jgi:hypothetical protein
VYHKQQFENKKKTIWFIVECSALLNPHQRDHHRDKKAQSKSSTR